MENLPNLAPPSGIRAPHKGKLDAIDYAVEYLAIASFADLGGIGEVHGQYSFYAAQALTVTHGVLADRKINDWARDQANQRQRNMRCVDGNFTTPEVVAEIGAVDAVMIFDVLVHTVAPDWDELLTMYADSTHCFIIANPQWQKSENSVRLLDLGREAYLDAVPPTKNHDDIFDRLDEWFPAFNRSYRDAMHIWQWGITDRDLVAHMDGLDFRLDYYARLKPFWGTNGFLNTAFVFRRR